jgi:hypothetical protein
MQIWHEEELASFGWWWTTEAHADASISQMQNHATVFEIDRMEFSLDKSVILMYIENVNPATRGVSGFATMVPRRFKHPGNPFLANCTCSFAERSRSLNPDLAAE